jgi:hypothetical protein
MCSCGSSEISDLMPNWPLQADEARDVSPRNIYTLWGSEPPRGLDQLVGLRR